MSWVLSFSLFLSLGDMGTYRSYFSFLSFQFLGGSGVLSHGAGSSWSISIFWTLFSLYLFLLDRRYIIALGTLIEHGL